MHTCVHLALQGWTSQGFKPPHEHINTPCPSLNVHNTHTNTIPFANSLQVLSKRIKSLNKIETLDWLSFIKHFQTLETLVISLEFESTQVTSTFIISLSRIQR